VKNITPITASKQVTPRMKPESPRSFRSEVKSVTWTDPLLDIVYALAYSKFTVLAILVLGVSIGSVRLMRLPATYKASAVAVLMPREKPMLDASIDTSSIETSDDRASRGLAGNLMLPPNPNLYTTLINSRGVIERIGARFEEELVGDLFPNDRSEEIYYRLKSMIQVNSTEEGLITITVTSEKPVLCAGIANELFAECERASKAIERQLILQQAGHLDDALEKARIRLRETESQLEQFAANYELVDVDLQAGNKLRSQRELEAAVDLLETDLGELRMSYTEHAPEVQRIKARIQGLKRQFQNSQDQIVGQVGATEYGAMRVALDSLNQKVRFERDLVSTLSTKTDIYKIRAEQPTGNLAIIRAAQIPDRPAGPSKKKELGVTLFVSLVAAFGFALIRNQWQQAIHQKITQEKLRRIRDLVWSSGVHLEPVEGYVEHHRGPQLLMMPPFGNPRHTEPENAQTRGNGGNA